MSENNVRIDVLSRDVGPLPNFLEFSVNEESGTSLTGIPTTVEDRRRALGEELVEPSSRSDMKLCRLGHLNSIGTAIWTRHEVQSVDSKGARNSPVRY